MFKHAPISMDVHEHQRGTTKVTSSKRQLRIKVENKKYKLGDATVGVRMALMVRAGQWWSDTEYIDR